MGNLTHGGDIYSLPSSKNILDFSTNINPLGIHPDVKQAVISSIDDCTHYPDPLCRELLSGIAGWEQIMEANIVCGNGAADIIFRLVQLLKPKNALLLAPTFSEYECALKIVRCNVEYTHLHEEEGFALTERILENIHPGLEMMFVCNPNNPTGLLVTPDLMLRILDKCIQNGVFLVVDECFNGFLNEPEIYSLKRYMTDYKNLFILKAFTKLFAIPGLRLGYGLCADNALIDSLRQCGQSWSVSIPAQTAGIAALNLNGYVERTHSVVSKQRNWLKEQLSGLGFSVYDSTANYLFVKCEEAGLKKYLISQGILIRDCANYEGLTSGYYRFAVLDAQSNHRLIKVLGHAVKQKEIFL
jgi:threonine-phosphate decarboxylase